MLHYVHQLVTNCVFLCQLPAEAKNDARRVVRLNQNRKVVGQTAKHTWEEAVSWGDYSVWVCLDPFHTTHPLWSTVSIKILIIYCIIIAALMWIVTSGQHSVSQCLHIWITITLVIPYHRHIIGSIIYINKFQYFGLWIYTCWHSHQSQLYFVFSANQQMLTC